MSDGSRLHQSWYDALNEAELHFRRLLTSSSLPEWKRVANTTGPSSSAKGKARTNAIPELADVVVHRKATKAGDDVYRIVLDVPTGEDAVTLEPWKAVLTTPELRQEWDPAVEDAHLVEVFDHTTRICKTNFTLGWPANPRDTVTISRTFNDASTIIDISTSLPRSLDEPAYLRPSPPYVRSNVTLFAWCVQYIQPALQVSLPSGEQAKRKNSAGGRIRITCFWQHDLRTAWNFGAPSGIVQQLCTMTLGLLKTVKKRGSRIAKLVSYGNGVTIERVRFQMDREALTVDYAIIPEEEEEPHTQKGLDEVYALREQKRLTRSIECVLPSSEGWDVRLTTRASSEEVEKLPWSANAIRSSSYPLTSDNSSSPELDQVVLRFTHAPLLNDHSILKVRVVVEISGSSSGLRLNGFPQTIMDTEERDPSSYSISQQILQDVTSTADLSFNTASSINTVSSAASTSSSASTLIRTNADRTPAAEKSILSRVRRNYIYFSSLLQEPEAKWKRTTEARGVSITQLDSIDPTLVVYRAEATFVGVGLWDLYGALVTPGAKIYWDKQHEDAALLEDVNELTELWHFKTKPAWPANGRDSVVLKTVYKSPTTIHVFSFSAEDSHLFPSIPPVEANVIRTQVDLQGWAIEALSPTTTLLTLLEQSDPKGWTNKTSIPTQMISALAGIGEFAIKCGGPPVVTRLAGAKANEIRYDHERGSFRIEYEGSASRRSSASPSDATSNGIGSPSIPIVECEVRCDIDTWASSLDIVVDPPPQNISCLRRHRLSAQGGGLWLTLTHDAVFVGEERLLVIVRRGPTGNGKDKGLVMVNGTKVAVDVEELPEHEIKSLTKRKRVKPPRIPLDQPPVMGVIRRRRAEWDADAQGESSTEGSKGSWASAPKISSPLARFFTYAIDSTQQAVAAISPSAAAGDDATPSSSKPPMQYALEALAWMRESHSRFSSEGWVVVTDKGLPVRRKLSPEMSPVIPVHKGEKVIEGISAEELASVVTETDCRKEWDDRFDSCITLESFGAECRTSFAVWKGAFPFRDRGFYLASVMARAYVPSTPSRRNTADEQSSNTSRNAIFCVSASFSPESVSSFSSAKYNPYNLPVGRVFVDAWILETLDPYTTENYAIPSTRCTRVVAVDYAGSIPAAVNSMINASIPRSILALEAYVKDMLPLPITRLPAPGLVVSDKRMEESFTECSWKLRRRDDTRLSVGTTYNADSRVYRSTILLDASSTSASRSPTATSEQMTPRPSRIILSPVTARNASLSPPDPSTQSSSSTSQSQQRTTSASSSSDTFSAPVSISPRQHVEISASTIASGSVLRGRSSSSAFTVKGELKPSTDLLMGEIVVDAKLYSDGYSVVLRSRIRTGAESKFVPLISPSNDIAGSNIIQSVSPKPSSKSTQNSGSDEESSTTTLEDKDRGRPKDNGEIKKTVDEEKVLPIGYTVHTMPSSPLHSSGLNGEHPTRHLIRLTLPTAQYQISTVQDPLTGEMRSAPTRPAWLIDLQEKGAVVDVEVRPAAVKTVDDKLSLDAGTSQGSKVVVINGTEVVVLTEKESLTNLGREELQDDRVSKMAVLSRIWGDDHSEVVPEELVTPIAIAQHLLDPAATVVPSSGDGLDHKDAEDISTVSETSEDSVGTQPDVPSTPNAQTATGSNRFLGFLGSYQNLFAHAHTATTTNTSTTATLTADVKTEHALASETSTPLPVPGGLLDLDASTPLTTTLYPLSTVIIVSFIAFLLGSLLRSLLSPADFIYVLQDVPTDVDESTGWREIRRLLEVKYLVGGWDFQIAVVRRH